MIERYPAHHLKKFSLRLLRDIQYSESMIRRFKVIHCCVPSYNEEILERIEYFLELARMEYHKIHDPEWYRRCQPRVQRTLAAYKGNRE